MAIRPISSTGYYNKNNTNMVQFGARKNEENREYKGSSIRNTAMAVPLATLLAMSPLNASSVERNSVFVDDVDNTEMVEKKKYVPPEGVTIRKNDKYEVIWVSIGDYEFSDYKCKFNIHGINPDNKFQFAVLSRKYELKNFPYEDKFDKVEEIRKVNYVISDCNDNIINKFSADQLVTMHGVEYNDPAIVKVAKDFMNGKIDGAKNDGAIKIGDPITRRLYLRSFTLSDEKTVNDWLGFAAKNDASQPEPESWGKVILSKDIKTNSGNYRLNARDKDGDPNTFEQLTLVVDGKAEFNVGILLKSHINIYDNNPLGSFDANVIYLVPKRRGVVGSLVDEKLYKTLMQVTKDSRYNNALRIDPDKVNDVDLKEFYKK